MPIKLLMVTRENRADKRYGLGKSLIPIMAGLVRRGVTVRYLCQDDRNAHELARMQLWHHWLVRLFGGFFHETEFNPLLRLVLERLSLGRLAARVAAREGYSHVHCHDPFLAAGYRRCAALSAGPRARWGVTEHGFGCYTDAFHSDGARLGPRVMRALRQWEARTLRHADWVLAPTQLGLNQLAQDLAIAPIPPAWRAIPHASVALHPYTRAAARQQLGWSPDALYALTVGRLVPLKQFPALIRALAAVPAPPWHLVIVGDGDRAPLQALAAEQGVASRLHFAVSDDMGLYYAAADLYVSASLTESFGLASREALGAGLPAICTAVGGVPEAVGSGAWLIPAQDPAALTQALHTLLASADERRAWAQRARQWAQTWPTVEQITDAYLAMYTGRPAPQ